MKQNLLFFVPYKIQEQYNNNKKRWIKENINSGKCCKCKLQRLETSNIFCERHYYEDLCYKALKTKTKWKFIKELLEKQNFKCHYSGLDLVLGVNASIDHTKSKKLHPESALSTDNIKWVDIRVNRMKREMNEDEFFNLCKLIVNKNIS